MNSADYNPNNPAYHEPQCLGTYHLGLFYSSTVFHRYSVAGRHPALPSDDIDQVMTSHHESFHCVQDLATGFGSAINETLRSRDEGAVEDLKHLLGTRPAHSLPLNAIPRSAAQAAVQKYKLYDRMAQQLLRESHNAVNLSALHVLEGAAALYTEIYRRWHIHIENRGSPAEFQNIYDFSELCSRIDTLPDDYRSALQHYRDTVVPRWRGATDVDLCNLFFVLCDLALQIPRPVPQSVSEDDRRTVERYFAGDRFWRLASAIAEHGWFPSVVPMKEYKIVLVVSDGATHLAELPSLKEKLGKAEALEARFHRARSKGARRFARYVDSLCKKLGWESVSQVCDGWITLFQEQIRVAPREEILRLRLRHITRRKTTPAMLAAFPNIRSAIIERDYPGYCITPSGTKVWGPASQISGSVRNVVEFKMFTRAVARQALLTGLAECPYASGTIYNCPQESPACSKRISPLDNEASQCLFAKLFSGVIGADLAEAFGLADHRSPRRDLEANRERQETPKHDPEGLRKSGRSCDRCGRLCHAVIEGRPVVVHEVSRFVAQCGHCMRWVCSDCACVIELLDSALAKTIITSNRHVEKMVIDRHGGLEVRLFMVECPVCGEWLGGDGQDVVTVFTPDS